MVGTDLPTCAVVLGSVTPPAADITDALVHLGCTKEVSSFDVLLQNWDKTYSPSGTYPIQKHDAATVSMGRGSNTPLLITGLVEKIKYVDTPTEHYVRVLGRCKGRQLFSRTVTKSFFAQKGEYILKDVIDNFTSLSHLRSAVELIEDTDTTFVELDYEDSPVWDIATALADAVDLAGTIGYDFRVAPDGKFEFFPRLSKSSGIDLTDLLENTEYDEDILRIKNKITVYGIAGKDTGLQIAGTSLLTNDALTGQKEVKVVDGSKFPSGIYVIVKDDHATELNRVKSHGIGVWGYYPNTLVMQNNLAASYEVADNAIVEATVDPWTESLTDPVWTCGADDALVLDGTNYISGAYSVYVQSEAAVTPTFWTKIALPDFMICGGHGGYQKLNFALRRSAAMALGIQLGWITQLHIEVKTDDSNYYWQNIPIATADYGNTDWNLYSLGIGRTSTSEWNRVGDPDWFNINVIQWEAYGVTYGPPPNTSWIALNIDRLYFSEGRFSGVEEDLASQGDYDLQELVETNEGCSNDDDCQRRATALLNYYSSPAISMPTALTSVLDYGTTPILAGDTVYVALPDENFADDIRVDTAEYRFNADAQTLTVALELGKLPPQLADYLYGMRTRGNTVEKLARQKRGQ